MPGRFPLADEILAVCRDAILSSQRPPGTETAKTRKRKAALRSIATSGAVVTGEVNS